MTPPDLAALADAVEQAAMDFVHLCNNVNQRDFDNAVHAWLSARRAAHAAGYCECLVSLEAVDALRAWKAYCDGRCPNCDGGDYAAQCTCGAPDYKDPLPLLARDLGPLLKE